MDEKQIVESVDNKHSTHMKYNQFTSQQDW